MIKIELSNDSWLPDRASVIPLFKQIYDFIITKISSGEWSIGSKLPTQMAMAKAFGVNRSTIIEVYDELKAEGLVESRKSSGTIIINNTWSILTSTGPTDWNKKISKSIHEPNLNIIKIINDIESNPDMIRLGAGELARDMMPDQYLKKAMTGLLDNVSYMGYEDQKGIIELREEIVRYLATKGIETQSSKVLIVSGGLQALHLISMGLLNRGATILTEKQSYLNSLTLFDSHRINLRGVETSSGGILLDDLTKKIVTQKPELLYTIPNFQNPSGKLMSESMRRDLLELCARERLAIIEDDVYGEIWFDEQPPLPLKAQDKNGNVLYIGSLSKSLSAGLRIGWIVGNENVIDRLADIKMQIDYGSSNMSQWLCYEFLSKGYYEAFVSDLRLELKKKRDFTLKILEENFSTLATWNIPKGGLYIWLTFNREIGQYKLFEKCFDQGIIINPGSLYDETDKKSIRLSFAYASRDELKVGLYKLAEIVSNEWI